MSPAPPPSGDGAARWTSRAFGLDLDLGFEAPALPRDRQGEPGPDPTVVEIVPDERIDEGWPRDEARLAGLIGPRDEPVMQVDEHVEAGYRIALPPYGRYRVSADGRSIACAPPDVEWWLWQRLLIGQVLPAAAALHEFELLHASAVSIGDRVIALAGPPGYGKSSLALHLLLRGHLLHGEDVVTLELRDERLIAEPGAAMLNVREDEFGSIAEADRARLGSEVGRSHGKVHLIAERDPRALPLGGLYLLDRGGAGAPVFEPLEHLRAADLLANSFVTYVHRSGRMIRQLDIAAAMARTVPIFRLRVQERVGAADLAGMVEEHAGALP